MVKIAPSLLSADFGFLAEEVQALEKAGADWLHFDVMDGHFVPNLTFGAPIIKALRKHSALTFDAHLMIAPAIPFLEVFAASGADSITIHYEAEVHVERALQMIRALGKKAGISIVPSTPPEVIAYLLDAIDLILVMSVNPGFGGQSFIPSQLDKIARIKHMIHASGKDIVLQVDGGINAVTAPQVVAAGADVLVAGSYIFENGKEQYQHRIKTLQGSK